MKDDSSIVDHYGAQYGHFASQLYSEIRTDTFGEDIGQNGWLTIDEQDQFISRLGLTPESRLLDVACGSGGPTCRIARITGCTVIGVDIHEQGIAAARNQAEAEALQSRVTFEQLDASRPLPFPDSSFDGLICIDALNHFPNRTQIFREWARLLRPGGHLVFTDPIVVTGPLTNEEIGIRSSIGFYLFVPEGVNERLLAESGFDIVHIDDRTDNMARMARHWYEARQARAADLSRLEGDATFEGQQRFFTVSAALAAERRLSRFAYHARLNEAFDTSSRFLVTKQFGSPLLTFFTPMPYSYPRMRVTALNVTRVKTLYSNFSKTGPPLFQTTRSLFSILGV